MPAKQVKKPSFKEVLIDKMEEYMDSAFATNDNEKRQKYREAIRQIESLILNIVEIE